MTTYIDDQDKDKISYTGTWTKGGTASEYNESVMSSTRVGDYFTVTFKGTNIAVFGTFDITSGGVVTTYTLDNAPPAQITSQAGSRDTHRQQFWRSNLLQAGTHKLVVNMTKVNSDPQPGEGTVWFDYFLVTDPDIPSTEAPGASPSATQTAGHKSAPIGAIVGGTIGGLFFLLALAFFFLLYRRRTRIQIVEEKDDEDGLTAVRRNKNMTIEPFVLASPPTSSNGTSTSTSLEQFNPALLVSGPPPMPTRKSIINGRPGTGHSTQVSVGNSADGVTNVGPNTDDSMPSSSVARNIDIAAESGTPSNRRTKRLKVETDSSPQTPSMSSTSATQDSTPVTLQHVDSGVRAADLTVPDANSTPRIELPPVYSPT